MSRGSETRDGAPTRIRCAIYTRKSTDEGLEQDYNSLDAQREAAEAYITSQRHEGWVILPEKYDDGGFTGGNMERPALKQLLRDVEQGKVDSIVVYKVDRLSRSLMDFARIVETLERYGVSFVSVTQQFNTTTPMGRLTLNILLSFAQFEREIISERVRDKIAGAKRKGKFTGGTPVLGYDVDSEKHRLIVNEQEARLVRHIFKRFTELGSGLAIARELNAKGIKTKSWMTKKGVFRPGKDWNASLIYRILNNRAYRGETTHKDAVYPGEHEAIVSKSLWDRVHTVLQSNPRKEQRTHEKVAALLRGIIRCGHCNRAMTSTYTIRNGRTYRYYVCTQAQKGGYDSCPVRTIAAGDIEDAVIGQLKTIFKTPEMIAQTLLAAKRLQADDPDSLQDSNPVAQAEVIDALQKLDPVWDSLYPLEQRRIIHLLVERVVVTIDGLDVRLRTDGLHSLISELEEVTETNNEEVFAI